MRIMITGNSGFIGSALTKYLRKEHTVLGYSTSLGCDVLNYALLERNVVEVDIVINCAAKINMADRTDMSLAPTNLQMAYNVFTACSRLGKPCIQVSSCEVFGNHDEPTPETAIMQPTCSYNLGKIYCDMLLLHMVDVGLLNGRIVRPFNPYGPSEKGKERIIRKFYNQVKQDKPITLYGDGSDFRDWTWEEDAARGIWDAHRLPAGEVVNLATGKATTNLEMAKLVMQILGVKVPIQFMDYPSTHNRIYKQVGDASKAKRLLGWEPTVQLEEGLTRTFKEWDKATHG